MAIKHGLIFFLIAKFRGVFSQVQQVQRTWQTFKIGAFCVFNG